MSNLSKTLPRKFWKKINRFKKGKLSSSDQVSIDEFVDHFKLISNTPHTDKTFDSTDLANRPINVVELDKKRSADKISRAVD